MSPSVTDRLLDEAAILACAMYVDLNPIRAAVAQSLEDSEFTGAKARIDDLKVSKVPMPDSAFNGTNHSKTKNNQRKHRSSPRPQKRTSRWERSRGRNQSGWLSPLEIKQASDPIGPDPSQCGRRASLKGFLNLPLIGYLELLDWTGRQLRNDKRGAIPTDVAPILDRLGIKSDRWVDLAQQFGRLFKRAAGSSISLAAESNCRGQNWLQASGASCFR